MISATGQSPKPDAGLTLPRTWYGGTPKITSLVAVGMSFGGIHGYAINPARDFGPRLFTAVAGFKNNGLTDGTNVFWIPIIGPIAGGLVGAGVYDLGIRRFLAAR